MNPRNRPTRPSTTQCMLLINRDVSRKVNEYLDFRGYETLRLVSKGTSERVLPTVEQIVEAMHIVNQCLQQIINNYIEKRVSKAECIKVIGMRKSQDYTEYGYALAVKKAMIECDEKKLDELHDLLPSNGSIALAGILAGTTVGTVVIDIYKSIMLMCCWLAGSSYRHCSNRHISTWLGVDDVLLGVCIGGVLVALLYTKNIAGICREREAYANAKQWFKTNKTIKQKKEATELHQLQSKEKMVSVQKDVYEITRKMDVVCHDIDVKHKSKSEADISYKHTPPSYVFTLPFSTSHELKLFTQFKFDEMSAGLLNMYKRRLQQTLNDQMVMLKEDNELKLLDKQIEENGITPLNVVELSLQLKKSAKEINKRNTGCAKELTEMHELLDMLIAKHEEQTREIRERQTERCADNAYTVNRQ